MSTRWIKGVLHNSNLSPSYIDFNGSGEGVYPLISSCNDKFYILNGICRPKCTTFESYAPEDTALVVGSQQFASSFGVFIGLIVLIISIFRWRVMYVLCNNRSLLFLCRITFPSAFLICSTISYCVPCEWSHMFSLNVSTLILSLSYIHSYFTSWLFWSTLFLHWSVWYYH